MAEPLQASARWELVRALGAVVVTPPPGGDPIAEALGLPVASGVEYTEAFVLSAPPYAAIHLGPEGKLGGEGLDRVAGFWRAIGLSAPQDADQLGVLLMLYAQLGEAELGADERRRSQLRLARAALLHEHLWSWAPGYLRAIGTLGVTPAAQWASLALEVLVAECRSLDEPAALALALREAPAGIDADASFDALLDAVVAPVRSGMILTRRDLMTAAAGLGLGYRHGERRYTLKAMLGQDPVATLSWLAKHAATWADRHLEQQLRWQHDPALWWSQRAADTARTLAQLAATTRSG